MTKIVCKECGKKFDITICDLEYDGAPICPNCPPWEPDKQYQAGYDYACGYRDE